ncbi:MAG: hypothetical protein ACT4NU_12625 [Chromatiales bacterium]
MRDHHRHGNFTRVAAIDTRWEHVLAGCLYLWGPLQRREPGRQPLAARAVVCCRAATRFLKARFTRRLIGWDLLWGAAHGFGGLVCTGAPGL